MATAAQHHNPPTSSTSRAIPDTEEVKKVTPLPQDGLQVDTKTFSATGQQWFSQSTEYPLGDNPRNVAKSVNTRVINNMTQDSTYSEAAAYSTKTPEGHQDRIITVEKVVNIAEANPNLRTELTNAKIWSQENDTADLQKLARSGFSISDSASTTVVGPSGSEHKSTDTRTFNKDGSVTTSHEEADTNKFSANGKDAAITVTNHTDKTVGANGAVKSTHTFATKKQTQSQFEADGAIHTGTHTEFVAPQRPAGSQQGLAPHVGESLEKHLSQNGYSAHDAAQTVRDVGPQLAVAIAEHAMGAGGTVEFHPSGPVAVSLASAQSEPQPGVVTIALDQLKAVHESGFTQTLAPALSLAATSGQNYQASREM